MEVDEDTKGGFKIKGQAEIERRKSKWEVESSKDVRRSLFLSVFLSKA